MKRILAYIFLSLFFSASLLAEEFSFTDTEGKIHSLAAYRGKWVLINFWATWCPPCLGEIPDLVALHNAHKDKDLVVLGVSLDEGDSQKVLRFARHEDISYPIILGNTQFAAQVGPVVGLPNSYLYDPQGKLAAHNVGPLTRKAVEKFIGENNRAKPKPDGKLK